MDSTTILSFAAAFLSGLLASLGVGGGTVLLLYLTVFASASQLYSQGVNLLFFIPIAALALMIHTKNKLVKWKTTLWAALPGLAGVLLGSKLAFFIGSDLLRKIFGFFLLILGIKELFIPAKNNPN